MLLLLYNTIALILQFDGSLRVGHDPNPEIVSHSVSCKFLPPLASCSSALLQDNFYIDGHSNVEEKENTKQDNSVLATNGKILDKIELTSANVEYEGLLLGLEQVANFFDDSTSTSELLTRNGNTIIFVRGDCKTVIDQMNGVSIPRKQRDYFNRADQLVKYIETTFNVTFKFEHVLRDQNELCDSICHDIIQLHQEKIVANLKNKLRQIVSMKPTTLPLSKKKRFKFRDTHFATIINDLSIWDHNSRSLIPLSIRPYWLCKAAFYAEQIGDFVALRLIGEALIEQSIQWQKHILHRKNSSYLINQMKSLGKKLIFHALKQMELYKEALKILPKNNDDDEESGIKNILDEQLESFQHNILRRTCPNYL